MPWTEGPFRVPKIPRKILGPAGSSVVGVVKASLLAPLDDRENLFLSHRGNMGMNMGIYGILLLHYSAWCFQARPAASGVNAVSLCLPVGFLLPIRLECRQDLRIARAKCQRLLKGGFSGVIPHEYCPTRSKQWP